MKALITGIAGFAGSHLAELLLSQGFELSGISYPGFPLDNLRHLLDKLKIFQIDITSFKDLADLIHQVQPHYIFHLAAISSVSASWEGREAAFKTNIMGSFNLLESCRDLTNSPKVLLVSSGEIYGAALNKKIALRETQAPCPLSPYAAAKLYSYWMTVNYREGFNIFACNGILFNHESPRRGETFLTRKVTRAIANILAGKQKVLYLGNLNPGRDWGYAPEYVEAMWKILQLDGPDDFVIGTGEAHSVREFVEQAFSYVDLDFEKHLEIDPKYFRPTETEKLIADPRKAKKEIGWEPKIKFEDLVKIMIDADMRNVGLEPPEEGDDILKKKFPNIWWKGD